MDALLARDWTRFAATLTPGVRREGFGGPETDAVVGREPYLRWASDLIDPLYEYSWTLHRTEYALSGTSAFVEATSRYRVDADDEPFGYQMVLVFVITSDSLVSQVSLYWKTPEHRLPGDTITSVKPA